MVSCIGNYVSGVYQPKINSQVSKINTDRKNENANVSFGTSKSKEQMDEFISKDKEFLSTCTDGLDDGKISFKEGAKAFGGGVVNHFFSFIGETKKFIKENPLKTIAMAIGALAIGGIVICGFGAPAALGILSASSIYLGAKGLYRSVKGAVANIGNAKNAQTDAEKKQAVYGLGGNSAEFVESAVVIGGGAKLLKKSANIFSQVDDVKALVPKSEKEVQEHIKDFMERAKAGNIQNDEFDVMQEFINNREEIFKMSKEGRLTKLISEYLEKRK